MRSIVSIKFGSHLYGTATPASDLDFKSVFVPAGRDILLQRVKGSLSNQRPKAEGEKNVTGEIDEEAYSLQRYLGLAAEGQTVALDVLFAPRWAMTCKPAPEWQEIEANRRRLVTRKSASFLGYCRQQANKYGIKGSRVSAARVALELLTAELEAPRHNGQARRDRVRYRRDRRAARAHGVAGYRRRDRHPWGETLRQALGSLQPQDAPHPDDQERTRGDAADR